jgi:ATP adenylyltransferase
VSHEQLWAPWRLGYILAGSPASNTPNAQLAWLEGASHDCFLCRCVAETDDRHTFTAWRGANSMVVLNRYPYTNGHLLVAPRYHKARLDELSPDEHLEMVQTLARLTGVLERLMKSDGFNIGLNLGKVAGAGVPGHLHWHLVPRWQGDTNFMPVLADTTVIPQSLEALFDLLHRELN